MYIFFLLIINYVQKVQWKVLTNTIPCQKNGYDCGPFVISNAFMFIAEFVRSTAFWGWHDAFISQKSMSHVRKWLTTLAPFRFDSAGFWPGMNLTPQFRKPWRKLPFVVTTQGDIRLRVDDRLKSLSTTPNAKRRAEKVVYIA